MTTVSVSTAVASSFTAGRQADARGLLSSRAGRPRTVTLMTAPKALSTSSRRGIACPSWPRSSFSHLGALHVFWFSLTRHPDVVTRIVCVRRGQPAPGRGTESPAVYVCENTGPEPYPAVRRRAASSMYELASAACETCACAPPAPTGMDHSKWNCDAVSSLQPLEVWVAAREWDGDASRWRVG